MSIVALHLSLTRAHSCSLIGSLQLRYPSTCLFWLILFSKPDHFFKIAEYFTEPDEALNCLKTCKDLKAAVRSYFRNIRPMRELGYKVFDWLHMAAIDITPSLMYVLQKPYLATGADQFGGNQENTTVESSTVTNFALHSDRFGMVLANPATQVLLTYHSIRYSSEIAELITKWNQQYGSRVRPGPIKHEKQQSHATNSQEKQQSQAIVVRTEHGRSTPELEGCLRHESL